VRRVMASQLEPIAFELASGAGLPLILLRFASLPDVVEAQIAQATAGVGAFTTAIDSVDGDAERALWQAHATAMWDTDGAIVRVSWLPANITAAITELERITAALKMRTSAFAGRAAVGAGHVRVDGDVAEQASFIEQLRASPIFGNVVIVRGSVELKGLVDVWGSHGSRQSLFDSLKRAFDPDGVLNAGRGPL
jgi:hypothetical protein